MMLQRRFRRIRVTARASLIHKEVCYEGRLENASLSGALISFSERLPVKEREGCVVLIHPAGDEPPLQLAADVVHTCFTMVGIQFAPPGEETRQRLVQLVGDEPA